MCVLIDEVVERFVMIKAASEVALEFVRAYPGDGEVVAFAGACFKMIEGCAMDGGRGLICEENGGEQV
jgi:hypothetical protein